MPPKHLRSSLPITHSLDRALPPSLRLQYVPSSSASPSSFQVDKDLTVGWGDDDLGMLRTATDCLSKLVPSNVDESKLAPHLRALLLEINQARAVAKAQPNLREPGSIHDYVQWWAFFEKLDFRIKVLTMGPSEFSRFRNLKDIHTWFHPYDEISLLQQGMYGSFIGAEVVVATRFSGGVAVYVESDELYGPVPYPSPLEVPWNVRFIRPERDFLALPPPASCGLSLRLYPGRRVSVPLHRVRHHGR